MNLTNCQEPSLAKDDLTYTREIISPHLTSRDYPTAIGRRVLWDIRPKG